MSQVIKGFYDPANAQGQITHIVGGAQANKSEVLHCARRERGEPVSRVAWGSLGQRDPANERDRR